MKRDLDVYKRQLVHTARHTMGVGDTRSRLSNLLGDVYKRQEQRPSKACVEGSNPSALTMLGIRQVGKA